MRKVNQQMQPPIDIFNANDMNKNFPNYTIRRRYVKAVFFAAMGYVAAINDTEKKLISHKFEDTLISCQFNYADCTSNDFVWSFDPFYGNCYTFNKGKSYFHSVIFDKIVLLENTAGLLVSARENCSIFLFKKKYFIFQNENGVVTFRFEKYFY